MDSASALIILGGGVDKDGNLPPWVIARLQKTLQEWQSGKYTTVIASGRGRVANITDIAPTTEARAMADRLIADGIPAGICLVEEESLNTIENAYYCRLRHIDRLELRRLTVVTNQFHIQRAGAIFEFVFGSGYDIELAASEDTGIDPAVRELLAQADLEQSDFLRQHIFGRLQAGDLQPIEDFIFDKDDPGAREWNNYKVNSELYKRVTELMT